MAENIFSIELNGLEKIVREFKDMENDLDKIILEEMTEYGLFVEEGAKALAPIDEGDLEMSINFDEAKKTGDATYKVIGGSNLEYALRRHEEPGRGIGTINKPHYRGYMPGPKYLENAVKASEADFDKMMEIVLDRWLGENK